MPAKRHPNDRNERAAQKRMNTESVDELVLKDGTTVALKNVDPIFIQTVINSVEYPKRPTYEVKMASGRIDKYPMDEKVAEQSPELAPLWTKYRMDTQAAEAEQMKRMTRALILDGTVMPEVWEDREWERRMKIVGIDLPEDPEELWVVYLESKMTTAESVALTGKIMRRTGVPEEFILAAEDSFRGQVHGELDGAGDVADADADTRGDEQEVAGQVAA